MNVIPEEISSAWLESTKAGSKDKRSQKQSCAQLCYEHAFSQERQESVKKKCLLKVIGDWYSFIKNISHKTPHQCSVLLSLLNLF